MTLVSVFIGNIFALSGFICLVSLLKTREIKQKGIRQGLQGLLATSGLWAFTQFFQLITFDPFLSQILQITGLTFGAFTIVFWLYFVSVFTGRNFHQSKRVQRISAGVLSIVLLAKFTNPIHGLYFSRMVLEQPFARTVFDYHIIHHITTIVSYGLTLYGFTVLFDSVDKLPITRKQLVSLSGVLILPAFISILSITNIFPVLGSVAYDSVGVAIFALAILFFTDISIDRFYIERHNSFLDKIDDAIVIVDHNGILQDFNEIAEREPFNLTENSVGKNVELELDSFKLEDDIVTIAGSSTFSVLRADYETDFFTTHESLIFKDITEIEEQRNQLEIQNNHFENMIEGLSHEMRNGLQIIQGYSDLEEKSDGMEVISRTTSRLKRVNEDLTALAKIGSGHIDSGEESIDFTETMNKLSADSQLLKGIKLEYEGSGSVHMKEKTFRLLVEKNIRFAKETGAEKLSIKLVDDELIISNDGSGIAGRDPHGAFEYGKSIPSAELGSILPVVQSIADAHQLELEIEEHDTELKYKIYRTTQTSNQTQQ